jgi:hypothetical protein
MTGIATLRMGPGEAGRLALSRPGDFSRRAGCEALTAAYETTSLNGTSFSSLIEDRTRTAALKEERDPILRGKITSESSSRRLATAIRPACGRIETLRLS